MSTTSDRRYDVEPDAVWAQRLRDRYDEVAQEPLPDRLRDLLERLEGADARRR